MKNQDRSLVRLNNVIDQLTDAELVNYVLGGFVKLTWLGKELPFSLHIYRADRPINRIGRGALEFNMHFVHASEVELRE
ncbi:MAG: hypothetical protein AB7G93_07280 [Bdellovibrionales bacterium]